MKSQVLEALREMTSRTQNELAETDAKLIELKNTIAINFVTNKLIIELGGSTKGLNINKETLAKYKTLKEKRKKVVELLNTTLNYLEKLKAQEIELSYLDEELQKLL